MKHPLRQGKKDALAYKPRFVPKYWLDRDLYNRGYDEGLVILKEREAEMPDRQDQLEG